jgi:hypothetical protein
MHALKLPARGNFMQFTFAFLGLGALVVSASTFARTPECTNLDKAHWMPPKAMQNRLSSQGYRVVDFAVADTCYKARLQDRTGRQVDGYYNPVGGHPVRRQVIGN